MVAIKGIAIELSVRQQIGLDDFKNPIYSTTYETVENVLVSPLSDEEVLESVNLTGRKAVYQLAIPKGDTHKWENETVKFFGETWRVIGKPVMGLDALIPLGWNKKVKVESIVGEQNTD